MGDKFDIVIKCFTLLIREKELFDKNELQKNEISVDLVKSILLIKKTDKKPLTGGDTIVMDNLKNSPESLSPICVNIPSGLVISLLNPPAFLIISNTSLSNLSFSPCSFRYLISAIE